MLIVINIGIRKINNPELLFKTHKQRHTQDIYIK